MMTPAPSAFGVLLRFRLRRDRITVPVWVLSTACFALFGAAALAASFGSQHARAAATALITRDPSLMALRGVPDGAGAGAFFMTEMAAYLALLAAFMNTFLAVRHSRADEEAGRAELIVATRAGRGAVLASTVLHAVVANVALGIITTAALAAAGYAVPGSIVLGWSLAACGLAFFGIGLVCAQLFSSGRAANGCAIALIGVAYVLAASGDAGARVAPDGLHGTPSIAAWVSPIGWVQRSRAFTADLVWPGLLALALAIVLVAVAAVLRGVRDTGASLLPSRRGRSRASAVLRGSWSLTWRLQRGSVIAWGIGALLCGLMIGALGETMVTAAKKDPDLTVLVRNMTGGTGDLLQSFIGVMMGMVGLLATGAALQAVMRMRQDEALGTGELVLATRTGRIRWFLGYVVVGLVAAAVMLALTGAVAGATLAGQDGGRDIGGSLVGSSVALALGQLPAVAVYLAITALAFALVPRATIAVGWTVFGLGVVVGMFGGLFGVPDAVRRLVPGSHAPQAPLESADWSGAWAMGAIAVAAVIVAAVLVRRRSLVPNP